jgi:hypothetical protein
MPAVQLSASVEVDRRLPDVLQVDLHLWIGFRERLHLRTDLILG